MLFIITGPSGCGKSTIIRHVMRDLRNVRFSVSHTTRPKRPSEQEGRDYHFATKPEFERMIAKEQFVEWAVVHGHYYGTSKKEIASKGKNSDLVLDIDIQGARQIMSRRDGAVFVFILPPVFKELRRRLKERGEDRRDAIEERLRTAKKEIRHYVLFDYIVINNKLDRAVLELESIILGSRCRLAVRKPEIKSILRSFT
ncbi:MAG: guanylate kinase [Candidatus Aminicenantales bacterium]